MTKLLAHILLINIVLVGSCHAAEVLKTQKLAEGVYALVGPITNRTPENLGNNANFGVVITSEGVVLIDSGGTYKGAEMIHAAIRKLTDKPIKLVINTGGQDHRWMGNGYYKATGAHIIANEKAVADQKARTQDQLIRLGNLVGVTGIKGTEPKHADETFTENKKMIIGETQIEIYYAGHAHTPGDSFVWLPEHKIVFSGDIVYMDRMLSIGGMSAHKSWISAFEAMALLEPIIIVPGHGTPASLAKAKADSYDYLVFLRQAVLNFIDAGHGIEDIAKIDQSRFSYLENYDSLKGRNAQRVFEELEWE